MVAGLGTQEIVLILIVVVLLFGAKKLPELARGSGRALRIFKAETKGLLDDDEDEAKKTPEQRQIDAQRSSEAATRVENAEEQPRPDAER
jgi:sec-independent protein translocase protein TatA